MSSYIKVNCPTVFVAAVGTILLWPVHPENALTWSSLTRMLLSNIFRSFFLITFIYYRFDSRKKWNQELYDKENAKHGKRARIIRCMLFTLMTACTMDTANVFFDIFVIGLRSSWNWYHLPLFLVKLFVWEVLFDLGHYLGHRAQHTYKWLYYLGHYEHHRHRAPDAWDGLHITLDDAILTNALPNAFGMLVVKYCFGTFNLVELNLLLAAKTMVEVTGHCGVDFKGRSFQYFPYVPHYLGIGIETAAYHSLHHEVSKCNYSKRFQLWDVIFGTRQCPHEYAASKKAVFCKDVNSAHAW